MWYHSLGYDIIARNVISHYDTRFHIERLQAALPARGQGAVSYRVRPWPMFGPCYRQLCMCCTDSACFFRQCIAHINFVPNVRFRIVLVADLRGFKDGTSRRCWRGVARKDVHTPFSFHNTSAPIPGPCMYECFPPVTTSIQHSIPFLWVDMSRNILWPLCVL